MAVVRGTCVCAHGPVPGWICVGVYMYMRTVIRISGYHSCIYLPVLYLYACAYVDIYKIPIGTWLRENMYSHLKAQFIYI